MPPNNNDNNNNNSNNNNNNTNICTEQKSQMSRRRQRQKSRTESEKITTAYTVYVTYKQHSTDRERWRWQRLRQRFHFWLQTEEASRHQYNALLVNHLDFKESRSKRRPLVRQLEELSLSLAGCHANILLVISSYLLSAEKNTIMTL